VKIMPRKRGTYELSRRVAVKACREASALRAIDHPNVVKLYGAYQNATHLFLVMELVRGVELYDFLHSKPGRRLPPHQALVVFSQVVKGIVACHRCGVAHRDLKTENIMIDQKGNVRIVDFELANVAKQGLRTLCGSSYYIAPELCKGEAYDGRKTDVWSMGVLLYTMLVGRYPFQDESDAKLVNKILKKPVEIPQFLGAKIAGLLQKLLTKDPKARVSSYCIPHHEAFLDSKGRNAFFDVNDLPITHSLAPSSPPKASGLFSPRRGLAPPPRETKHEQPKPARRESTDRKQTKGGIKSAMQESRKRRAAAEMLATT